LFKLEGYTTRQLTYIIITVTSLASLTSDQALGDTAKLFEPIEWTFNNPSHSGNAYDVVATATFTHATENSIVTELYYDGGTNWKLRFTGTATGLWLYTTSSSDSTLNGLSGSVTVTDNPGVAGFTTKYAGGNRWGRTGLNEAFVPQFAMYSSPEWYHNNPTWIEDGIETFFGDHGFNGLNTIVVCRWFDINKDSYDDFSTTDPNPDPRTFEALELLITMVHEAGGVVDIWKWGDEQRKMTPIGFNGGKNGSVDQRLQRYICARLGPLPGWSMCYGFDLQEWVTYSDLQTWHNYMQSHLGWSHYLGGRSPNMTQIYDGLDYSSYQQHRPDYNMYVQAIEQLHTGKPTFFEDRFRVREDVYPDKDYTIEMTRRGLYHSTMAGGAANIWGYLIPDYNPDGSSRVYPNKNEILTYSRFFGLITAINNKRFTKDMIRDNSITDGVCLKESNNFYVFYKEDTSSISMNLSGMSGSQLAVAVDCQDDYEEIPLGTYSPGQHIFNAPHSSDWVVAVGGPIPGWSVDVDLGRVDAENGLYRVIFSDGDTTVVEQGGKNCRRNEVAGSDNYMYFNVVGSCAYQGSRPEVDINIEYYDTGSGTLDLHYDSIGGSAYKSGGSITLAGTNTWSQHNFHLTDAYFGNRQNNGADFRIAKPGGVYFYLNNIEVFELNGPPSQAINPNPYHQAANVDVNANLSWIADGATSYDVYLGNDETAVTNADNGSTEFQGNHPGSTFDPGTMNHFTQYFWRIDAINFLGTTSGVVWNFTTESVQADYDSDGDVDQDDFGRFQACLSGSGRTPSPGCDIADFDSDNDVDQEDFSIFRECMGGTNKPPEC